MFHDFMAARWSSAAFLIRICRALVIALIVVAAGPADAAPTGRLAEFLTELSPAGVVPGADRFGPVEGSPPAVQAFAGDRPVGYAYLNADVVNATGYSGKPINIVVGLSMDGRVVGAKLVEHHEPIVLIGIPQAKVEAFINGYLGRPGAVSAAEGAPAVDIISGATVTAMVIGDSITRSAAIVARSRGLGEAKAEAPAAAGTSAVRTVDETKTAPETWAALIADGSVRRLRLTVGDVNQAFERAGGRAAAAPPEAGDADDAFIDLYVALVSAPAVGRSLLGDAGWAQLKAQLKPGQQAVVIAANGAYSFKGSGYVRGGIFDRIEVIQGENALRFRDRDHQRLGDLSAAGAPNLNEIGLFTIPGDVKLDPVSPWRLQLLVQRATGARDKAFITFDLDYVLPDKFINGPPLAADARGADQAKAAAETDPSAAVWRKLWRTKMLQIGVLAVALAVLVCVFFFQDWFVRRPILYDRFRLSYLAFTLLWLGWYAKAQLSVVNVFTFANALRGDFRWEYFLMDPLIFILWSATAASILFWNRGAFCGWLCPFGAFQELLNRAARAVGLRQIRVPFGLHQRLWVLKYVIFLALFAISLYEVAMAERMSEVEPFKTAIVLRFMRDWPFVAFALALLVVSLFIERFFCRYLCPLGAALAIPARLRMFDWLRRYRECGNPCQRCGNECPVQAIHPEGHINPNECIQCLNCQVLYHDDRKCPVVIQRRLKREKREALAAGVGRPAPNFEIRASGAAKSLQSQPAYQPPEETSHG